MEGYGVFRSIYSTSCLLFLLSPSGRSTSMSSVIPPSIKKLSCIMYHSCNTRSVNSAGALLPSSLLCVKNPYYDYFHAVIHQVFKKLSGRLLYGKPELTAASMLSLEAHLKLSLTTTMAANLIRHQCTISTKLSYTTFSHLIFLYHVSRLVSEGLYPMYCVILKENGVTVHWITSAMLKHREIN